MPMRQNSYFGFCECLIFTWTFMFLKLSFLAKPSSAFVIPGGWWFTGFNYLAILHLKHSLSSIFWIIINPFLGWSNSFDNSI